MLDDRYHGIGRITEALLRQMATDPNLDVTVFLRDDQHSDRFDVESLIEDNGFRRLSFNHSMTSPAQWLKWPGALRRAGAQAALFPYHLGAALTGRARRYSIVHDCILEADAAFAPDARTRRLYALLTHAVVRRTTVLTPSRASADEITRYYHRRVADGHVLPWGVDPAFGETPAAPAVVGDQSIPDRFYLHVGARRPHKNVQLLIRMLQLLPPDEYLVAVGTSDARWPDPVSKLASELGVQERLIQLPKVTEAELKGLYAGALAFVYPSLVEGFGLPLLEAMAAGAPVVASDIAVFQEVAAGAAVLVSPNSAEGWAQAVRRLDDPECRRELIEKGSKRAAEADWAVCTQRLSAVLSAR